MNLAMPRPTISAAVALSLALVGVNQTVVPASAGISSSLANRQVGEIQQLVQEFPNIFGGVWADPSTGVVTINLVSGGRTSANRDAAVGRLNSIGTAADPAILSRPKHWTVRVNEDQGPSYGALKSALDKVPTFLPVANRLGSAITSWYLDSRQRAIVIGATAITPALTSAAGELLNGVARLVPSEMPKPVDRWIDSQAYYGGDHINIPGGNIYGCTSSFEAYDPNASNHKGVLSAGHCYSVGTVVAQGYISSGHLYSSGNIGKVTHKSYANYQPDAEFMDSTTLGTSVSDFIWLGGNPPNGIAKASGAGTSFQGLTVCFDGAWTGENCNAVVNGSEGCVNIGIIDCSAWPVSSQNGSRLTQSGDSGGPVFYPDGFGGLTAYGTITAVSNSQGTLAWYTDITAAINALGVGLIVN